MQFNTFVELFILCTNTNFKICLLPLGINTLKVKPEWSATNLLMFDWSRDTGVSVHETGFTDDVIHRWRVTGVLRPIYMEQNSADMMQQGMRRRRTSERERWRRRVGRDCSWVNWAREFLQLRAVSSTWPRPTAGDTRCQDGLPVPIT